MTCGSVSIQPPRGASQPASASYSESAQLSRPAFSPDGQNLRQLACHAKNACGRLQEAQSLLAHPALIEERSARGS